jgi:hypothetical protein
MEKDYKKLYFKYKKKYLKLKLGGGPYKHRPSHVAGSKTKSKTDSRMRPAAEPRGTGRSEMDAETENKIAAERRGTGSSGELLEGFFLHITPLTNLPSIIENGLGSFKNHGLESFESGDIERNRYSYFLRPANFDLINVYLTQYINAIAESLSTIPEIIEIYKNRIKLTMAFIIYENDEHINIINHPSDPASIRRFGYNIYRGEYVTDKIVPKNKIKFINVHNLKNTPFKDIERLDVFKGIYNEKIKSLRFDSTTDNLDLYQEKLNKYIIDEVGLGRLSWKLE